MVNILAAKKIWSILAFPRSPRQILIFISMATTTVLIFLATFHVVSYLYNESYVWQCTTFADWIAPVSRRSCNIKGYHDEYSFRRKRLLVETGPSKGMRIGLLMLYNDKDGTWDEELMLRVLKNREEYGRLHGYSMVVANDVLDKTRPPAWSKLLAADKHLDSFDYLMYIDMDIVIMNMDIQAEDFISIAPDKDMIMTEDWNGPNTGVWLVKKSPWSHWFLQTAFNQSQFIHKISPEGKSYPFEYEQRAVHYLLDSVVWRSRGLEKWPGNITKIRSHFHLLPQCSMNSYIIHPFYWKGDREESQYVKGDFLVHFAGKKGVIKTNLMSHYLNLAERL